MCANIKPSDIHTWEGLDSPGGPTWGYNQETGSQEQLGPSGLDFAEFQKLKPPGESTLPLV